MSTTTNLGLTKFAAGTQGWDAAMNANLDTVDAAVKVFGGSGNGHSKGLVPDPGATAGTTRYLREDGEFTVPPTSTSITLTTNGSSGPATLSNGTLNIPVPVTTSAGITAKGAWSSSATYSVNDLVSYTNGNTYINLTGANTGSPASDTTDWSLFVSGSTYTPPLAQQATTAVSTTLGNTETLVFDPTLLSTKNVVTPNNSLVVQQQVQDGGVIDDGTSIPGWVLISYNTSGPNGFTTAGTLTRLRIPAISSTPSGGGGQAVQAWIVRPTTVPDASGVISFSLVSYIGQVSRLNNASPVEFAGIAVQVQVGDLVALRGIGGSGLVYASQGVPYTNDVAGFLNLADMSGSALNNGGTTNHLAQARLLWYAEIVPQAYVLANAARVPDLNGNLASNVARSFDKPWAGKKVIAVGTSITAQNPAQGGVAQTILTGSGYISQAMRWANCDGLNNGQGSSGIVFDGTRPLSLSMTTAEETSLFGSSSSQNSYQHLLTGLGADLVIFDHGYNDRGEPIGNLFYQAGDTLEDGVTAAPVGVLNVNRKTYYGAANYLRSQLKADRPAARWLWITPISLFNPGIGSGTVDSLTEGWNNTNAIRTATLALAKYWGDPLLDWSRQFGLNWSGTQPNEVFGTTPNYRGLYNASTTYAQNDSVVDVHGDTYISMQGSNTGNTPSFTGSSIQGPTLPYYGTAFWAMVGHTADGVHPDQSVHDRAAYALYRKMLEIAQ